MDKHPKFNEYQLTRSNVTVRHTQTDRYRDKCQTVVLKMCIRDREEGVWRIKTNAEMYELHREPDTITVLTIKYKKERDKKSREYAR